MSIALAMINAALADAVAQAEPLPMVWVLQTYSGADGFGLSLWGTEAEALDCLKSWAVQQHGYPDDGAETLEAVRDFFEWDGAPDVDVSALTLPLVLSQTEYDAGDE